MLLQGLLLIVLLRNAYCASLVVTVDGTVHRGINITVYYGYHTVTRLGCYLSVSDQGAVIDWESTDLKVLDVDREYKDGQPRNTIVTYTYNAANSAAPRELLCTCSCPSNVICPCRFTDNVRVSLKAKTPTTSSTTTTHTKPTTRPSTTHSSASTTKTNPTTSRPNKNKFKGVNPLIYTVIAVFLLGTLAVVAIVTCWIRARKTFYRQHRLPQYTTPQDYFDGISDSDFTPLTANQFYASLRDAPPTYHESEVIEASLRDEHANDSSSNSDELPPPLPPRNIPRRSVSPGNLATMRQPAAEPYTLSPRELDSETLLVPSTALPSGAIPPMDAQM